MFWFWLQNTLINAAGLVGVLFGLYTFIPWIFSSEALWGLWLIISIALAWFGWVCGSNLKDALSREPLEYRYLRQLREKNESGDND